MTRSAFALLALNGAAVLASLGGLTGAWEIPQIRLALGTAAVAFAAGVSSAFGTLALDSILKSTSHIKGVRDWQRKIDKIMHYFYDGSAKFFLIAAAILFTLGILLAADQLAPCIAVDVPDVCWPQF